MDATANLDAMASLGAMANMDATANLDAMVSLGAMDVMANLDVKEHVAQPANQAHEVIKVVLVSLAQQENVAYKVLRVHAVLLGPKEIVEIAAHVDPRVSLGQKVKEVNKVHVAAMEAKEIQANLVELEHPAHRENPANQVV